MSVDKKECNHPSHLSEEEKYDIIAEKVFNRIESRAILTLRKYLDADYKYHIANAVTPLINEMLFKRDKQMQDYLNNNSIETITRKIDENRQKLNEDISKISDEKEKLKKQQITSMVEALNYYLEHECDEDYN